MSSIPTPSTRPPRVLVVDDDRVNLKVVTTILDDSTCDIQAASSVPEAMAAIKGTPPALILLDVVMPGMDGFEFCRTLQADPSTREIPVIFITSRSNPQDLIAGFEAGAVDYVTKPFEPLELRARVRIHLELKRRVDLERSLVAELHQALEKVQTLSGLIPICAHCRKVRDDKGFWGRVEEYLAAHSGATFTHGICPDCRTSFFPEVP